jgi:hypothetical protein
MDTLFRAFERTDEQYNIFQAVIHKEYPVIKVNAGAGTGKTFILLEVAQELDRRGKKTAYIVFNKHNADEAKTLFPKNTHVSTINSMAFFFMRIGQKNRNISSLYPSQIKNILKLNDIVNGVNSYTYCTMINKCLNKFCNSGSDIVDNSHLSGNTTTPLSAEVIKHTQALFNNIRPEVLSKYPLPHAVYLKAWQLNGAPGIQNFDRILLDESQDSNPVTISILKKAKALLLVGDSSQSIYGFRGTVCAMNEFDGIELPLTLSFRFGEEIAYLANKIISLKKNNNNEAPLRGLPSINTKIHNLSPGQKHTRIFRTNQDLIYTAKFLDDQYFPISIVGDMKDLALRLQSAWLLKNNARHYKIKHPLIAMHNSWEDLEEYAENNHANEIAQTYKIILEHDQRIPDIIQLLQRDKLKTQQAKITLVSGHRCKGMQDMEIVINGDFDRFIENGPTDSNWDDEMNLLYVAVTRAMRTLEIKSKFLKNLL